MRVLGVAAWIGLGLAGCTFGDTRELVLDGPPSVRTDALGPVEGPTAVLSDGTAPDGLIWSVSPTEVATVDAGQVMARAAGEATVTASWQGQQVQWTLVVDPAVQLSLVAPPASLRVGQEQQLSLEARVGSDKVEVSGVEWTSSHAGVLAVSASGQVRGVSPGTAYVIAKRGQSEAMAEIVVSGTD